mmetsp:Transcript_13397/g.47278  ORF Transcript_13397/g.47278 Transcript_13397/m.47278 type:complete len:237 (-) Transcript_13397:135-845(-)
MQGAPPAYSRTQLRALESELHKAVFAEDVSAATVALEALSKLGVPDLSARDRRGFTALHYAAGYASVEIVKLLLEWGVDPSATDNNGATPLDELDYSELKCRNRSTLARFAETQRILKERGARRCRPEERLDQAHHLRRMHRAMADSERSGHVLCFGILQEPPVHARFHRHSAALCLPRPSRVGQAALHEKGVPEVAAAPGLGCENLEIVRFSGRQPWPDEWASQWQAGPPGVCYF